MENNSPKSLGYVVVTDYIEANTGKDVSSEIQKIIDENPMRTIYFPDGEYILAKPICTPSTFRTKRIRSISKEERSGKNHKSGENNERFNYRKQLL